MSIRSVNAGGTVDIDHLEREIRADVANFRRYKAEDGMKKRAIHTSKDYGEFRNFVSVSELKPTSGSEVSNLFSGASGSISSIGASAATGRKIRGGGQQSTIGGFDDIIQRRKDACSGPSSSSCVAKLEDNLQSLSFSSATKATASEKSGKYSTTTKSSRAAHDFLREWKQHCTSAKDTFSFITRIEGSTDAPLDCRLVLQPREMCEEYFSTEIDGEIVGDIIEALHLPILRIMKNHTTTSLSSTRQNNDDDIETDRCDDEASGIPAPFFTRSNVWSFMHNWLEALATCGRFELAIFFLVPDQQMKLKEICNCLAVESNETPVDDALLLRYNDLLK